jgi:hypothetical protein
VELFGLTTKLDVILPNLPALPLLFESLLKAHDGLLFFSSLHLARGDIAPCFRILIIDGDGYTKCKNGILPFLESHIRTSESKPGFLVESVNTQSSLEAVNGGLEIILEEIVAAKTAHGTGKLVPGSFPSLLVIGMIPFNVPQKAKDSWWRILV